MTWHGVSDASGAFPHLAGQSAYYLAKQAKTHNRHPDLTTLPSWT
jgi:hypothetical protein